MTEKEICSSYRRGKKPGEQIKILTELTLMSKEQIIGILLKNGEDVPKQIKDRLFKRMDRLKIEIAEREQEYMEIAEALKGETRRK